MTEHDAWHPRNLGPQTRRTIVVTGANSGIASKLPATSWDVVHTS